MLQFCKPALKIMFLKILYASIIKKNVVQINANDFFEYLIPQLTWKFFLVKAVQGRLQKIYCVFYIHQTLKIWRTRWVFSPRGQLKAFHTMNLAQTTIVKNHYINWGVCHICIVGNEQITFSSYRKKMFLKCMLTSTLLLVK